MFKALLRNTHLIPVFKVQVSTKNKAFLDCRRLLGSVKDSVGLQKALLQCMRLFCGIRIALVNMM